MQTSEMRFLRQSKELRRLTLRFENRILVGTIFDFVQAKCSLCSWIERFGGLIWSCCLRYAQKKSGEEKKKIINYSVAYINCFFYFKLLLLFSTQCWQHFLIFGCFYIQLKFVVIFIIYLCGGTTMVSF